MKSKIIAVLILVGILSACSSDKSKNEVMDNTVNLTQQNNQTENSTEGVQDIEDVVNETKGERVFVKIPAPSLENNIIGEETEQEIGIYLPPNYNLSDKNYPVFYFLPGFEDSYKSYLNVISNNMDELLLNSKIEDMIVVCVNAMNKLDGHFYYNSPVTGTWEDFVAKDVVTYIDDNYRTIKNANARALAGHSMGGFGVLNIAMHTKDLFNYAYSMSPGVFDENGFANCPMKFKEVEIIITQYKEMDNNEAKENYFTYIDKLSWSTNFSFAYGSTFASDANGKAPFIRLPEKIGDGDYVKDEVWKLYEAGYGNIPEKLDMYKDNLLSLKGFKIEYGTLDEFQWICRGCDYLSLQLTERDIPHELITYNGNHQGKVHDRIKDEVLPFFSDMFKKNLED